MSLDHAPEHIESFDTKLKALASYPSGVETHYPEAPENTTATHIVLVDADDQFDAYAFGCAPLSSGQVAAVIYGDMTVGELKQLARDLFKEAIAEPTGIRLRSGGVPIVNRAGKAKRVGGHSLNVAQLTFQYGLTA